MTKKADLKKNLEDAIKQKDEKKITSAAKKYMEAGGEFEDLELPEDITDYVAGVLMANGFS